ncbi:Uncharacterized protein APZ42_004192, partial [Daphnia magna]
CLQLLVLLLRLIPSLKKIRVVSQKSIIERVVYFIKANDDILSIIEEKPHLKESPFLCCVGSHKNPVCFNIVCEGEVYNLKRNKFHHSFQKPLGVVPRVSY